MNLALNQQPVINEVFNADTAGQEEGNVHVGKSEMINSLQSNFLDNVVSQIQKEDLQQQNFEKDNNISQVDENCVQKENCITENTEIQGFTENVKFQSPQILSNGNVPTVDLQTKETGLEQGLIFWNTIRMKEHFVVKFFFDRRHSKGQVSLFISVVFDYCLLGTVVCLCSMFIEKLSECQK